MRPASAQLYAQNLRGNRNVGALVVYGFYAPVVTDDRPLTVHDMLRFAQEMQECRKVHFAKCVLEISQRSI
jgi:hypothetical protein